MIKTALTRLGSELDVLFLPIQMIGKSNEHLRSPGTISYSAENLIRIWVEIGDSVYRGGLRKLVIVNSHGGNIQEIGIVARELRVRHNMLVATTQWRRFGLPPGMYSEFDVSHGIHAGDIETSLMLHFRPDLVEMGKAKLFPSKAAEMEEGLQISSPGGCARIRLDRAGPQRRRRSAMPRQRPPKRARLTAEHQADGFIAFLARCRPLPFERARLRPRQASRRLASTRRNRSNRMD
jgi:creatinine amidohydrolase